MLAFIALVAGLACHASAAAAPPRATPVCSKSPYNQLIPLSSYSSASAYCYSKYPVAAVTTTSTYTPRSTQTGLVVTRVTLKSTSTSVKTVSYTSIVSTVFIQKREPAVDSSSSLSSRWKSISLALSKSGTAAFSTACSCMETAKTVKAVATASPIILHDTSTSTSTKILLKVVSSTKSVLVPATATNTAAGSCPSLGSTFTDSANAKYNIFCKSSYTRTEENTLGTQKNVANFKSCIQQCSTTTGCGAVNYVRANSQCFLLSAYTPLGKIADTTTDCAVNVNPPQAPPGSAASLGSAYQPTDSPLTFTIAFGNVYSYPNSNLISSTNAPTFQACVDSCANSRTCLLAFRSRSTGNCLLFNKALQPQAKKLRVRDGTTPTDGDSAALDASALTPCSSLSNPYSSSDGTTYNFDCNGINDIGPHSELIMSYTTGRAFSECMDLCSTTAGCVASTYFPSANASNNECYLLKDILFGIDPWNNVNSAILASYPVPPVSCSGISALGSTMSADKNSTFTVSCDQSYDTSTNRRNYTMPSFKICVFQCSSFSWCQAADYDENTQLCRLMTSNAGSLTSTTGCSTALLVTPPAQNPPSPSPAPDPAACSSLANRYTTSSGQQYNVSCDSWLQFPNSNFIDFTPTGGISTLAQCMDLCATTPACRAVDYDRNGTTCILLKMPNTLHFGDGVTSRSGGYDFAQLAPAPRSCEALDMPYTSYSGPQYELKCDYKPTFGPDDVVQIFAGEQDLSPFFFQNCVDVCSDQPGCNVASFNGTHCLHLYNEAYSDAMSTSTDWDTARLINPPSGCNGLESPYTTTSNDMFDLECYHWYPDNSYLASGNETSFEACMESCTTNEGCVGVQYWFTENPTKSCDLLSSVGAGAYRGDANTALRANQARNGP